MRVVHGHVHIEVPLPAWAHFTAIYPRYDPRHRLLFRWYLSRLPVSPEVERQLIFSRLEKELGG